MSSTTTPLIGGPQGFDPNNTPDAILRALIIVVDHTTYEEKFMEVRAKLTPDKNFHIEINGQQVVLPFQALGKPSATTFEDGGWEGQVWALEKVDRYRDALRKKLTESMDSEIARLKECQARVAESKGTSDGVQATIPQPH